MMESEFEQESVEELQSTEEPLDTEESQYVEEPRPDQSGSWLKDSAWFLIGVAVLAIGGGIGTYWMMNKPVAERKKPPVRAALVIVEEVRASAQAVSVDALGTVMAVRKVSLTPRVSGEILKIADELVPGGHFKVGDMIAKIDPADYEIALSQRQAELASREAERLQRMAEVERIDSEITSADAALALERGQQDIAKREYELLGKMIREEDRELVLRGPQLKTAEASCAAARIRKKAAQTAVSASETAIESAKLSIKRAKLDLTRTTLKAPFNAIVDSRDVNLGSQVSPGTRVANLIGTDEYWVEALVPVDQLRWLKIPRSKGEQGSTARITHEAAWAKGASRNGSVVRLRSDIDPGGRMARVLVSVTDPISLKDRNAPAMILGAYVRLSISGETLENVFRVPRSALHDGVNVWVMSPKGKLNVREVSIVWSGSDSVYVKSGLRDGDKLVTSDVATPVEGMPLRTNGNGSSKGAAEEEGKSK